MPHCFLRLLLSFASVPVKLVGRRKNETVSAHIVWRVHLKKKKIYLLLRYGQGMTKEEAKNKKKELCLSKSFRL
jgi:hypothetical protein